MNDDGVETIGDGAVREPHVPLGAKPEGGLAADFVMAPIVLAMTFRLIFDERREFDRNAAIAAHVDMIFNGLLPR